MGGLDWFTKFTRFYEFTNEISPIYIYIYIYIYMSNEGDLEEQAIGADLHEENFDTNVASILHREAIDENPTLKPSSIFSLESLSVQWPPKFLDNPTLTSFNANPTTPKPSTFSVERREKFIQNPTLSAHGFVSGDLVRTSQGVTHPGTTPAQARLTTEFQELYGPKTRCI